MLGRIGSGIVSANTKAIMDQWLPYLTLIRGSECWRGRIDQELHATKCDDLKRLLRRLVYVQGK